MLTLIEHLRLQAGGDDYVEIIGLDLQALVDLHDAARRVLLERWNESRGGEVSLDAWNALIAAHDKLYDDTSDLH